MPHFENFHIPANDNGALSELGPKKYTGTLEESQAEISERSDTEAEPFGDIAKRVVKELDPSTHEEWIDGEPPIESE